MANDVEIKVKVKGADAAADDIDQLRSSVSRLDRTTASSARGLDKLADSADVADTRAMGFRDTLTGAEDSMKGWNIVTGKGNREAKALQVQIDKLKASMEASGGGTKEQREELERLEGQLSIAQERTGTLFDGILALGFGFGDLASGIANFGAAMSKQTLQFVANTTKMVVANARAVATTVAGWILMGVQAMANGAKMAAAWLISLGPIGLVIAAIAAIIAILYALGFRFDDFKRLASNVWNAVKGATAAAWDFIKNKVSGVVNWLLGIPRAIKATLSGIWSGLLGNLKGIVDSVVNQFNRLMSAYDKVLRALGGGGSVKGAYANLNPKGSTHGAGGQHAFAHGGLSGGGWAMVGEQGRELLNLPPGTRTNSNPDTERMLGEGGMGGVTVNLYVAGSIHSNRDIVELIRNEALRGGFRGAFA